MASLTKSNRTKALHKGAGRPKGSKNRATLFKEAINGDFERSLSQNFREIMGIIIQQAKEGCRPSQKLLLDKVVQNASTDDKAPIKDFGIKIVFSDMTPKKLEHIDVIEGEISETQEESGS